MTLVVTAALFVRSNVFNKAILGHEIEMKTAPKARISGKIRVRQCNNVSKTKYVKYISMFSTIHTFEMIDSSKTDKAAATVIQMSDVILVQGIRAKILQNLKQIGIKLNLVWLEA